MSKATFTNLTTDLDVIQKLDDLPNAVGGLSAAALKAKFDEAANAVKDFINTSLLVQLQAEASGAAGANRVGISAIPGITGANNVQDALELIYNVAKLAQAGDLQDDVIHTNHIINSAVTTPKINDGAVTTAKLAAGAVTGAKTDFSAGLTVAGDLTPQGKIVLDSDCYGDTLPAAGTPGRLFFLRVQ